MSSTQKRATGSKRALYGTYLLLGASIVVMGLTLAVFGAWSRRVAPVSETSSTVYQEPTLQQPAKTSPPQQEELPVAATKKSSEAIKPAPRVAIVIDDVGNNLDELDIYLTLPMPITFAVMPQRQFSREAVERIRAAGKAYIMHQPMEPEGDSDPGEGAIFVGMSRAEVRETLAENLANLDGAPGINNHMGSKVTADPVVMTYILEYLKEQGMFFLDSLTTGESVGSAVAEELQLPHTVRNSMFLDNNREREYVERALRSGFDIAANSGRAVMIGHVWDETLANLLLELYPEFDEAGFSFDDIGNMIYLGQQERE